MPQCAVPCSMFTGSNVLTWYMFTIILLYIDKSILECRYLSTVLYIPKGWPEMLQTPQYNESQHISMCMHTIAMKILSK